MIVLKALLFLFYIIEIADSYGGLPSSRRYWMCFKCYWENNQGNSGLIEVMRLHTCGSKRKRQKKTKKTAAHYIQALL